MLNEVEPVVTLWAEPVDEGIDGFPAQAETVWRATAHGGRGQEVPAGADACKQPPRGLVLWPDEQLLLLVVVKLPACFMGFALGDRLFEEGAGDCGQFPNWPW